MKRAKFLFESIVEFDNIRLAWTKARRGKTFSYSVVKFRKSVDKKLSKITERLKSENPGFGKYRHFYISDPKRRLISAASFEERIMHHAVMNILEPVFERQMIFHSYACRKGKGTHAAIAYAYRQCRRFPFVMKLDVKKYFDSIDHGILEKLLARLIKDSRCLNILYKIIESYSVSKSPDCGLPIGNLTSQFFANFYLSFLDHHLLEKIHVAAYCRYMDDILVFGNSKAELHSVLIGTRDFCSKNLSLKIKEPVIVETSTGIPFLGYLIGNKKIRLLRTKFRAKLKKLLQIEHLLGSGQIDEEICAERMNAVCNVVSLT